jgi:hypothetical protein
MIQYLARHSFSDSGSISGTNPLRRFSFNNNRTTGAKNAGKILAYDYNCRNYAVYTD